MRLNILFLLLPFLLIACGGGSSSGQTTTLEPEVPNNQSDNPDALNVPDGFDYKMHRDVTLKLQVLDHNSNPGKYIGVQVFEADSAGDINNPSNMENPNIIFRGQTDVNGYFEDQIRLPSHSKEILVQVSQLGIENSAVLTINNHDIFHEFK